MDYNALANELTLDPIGAGYASMSDEQIAASLSLANIKVRQRVTIKRLQESAYQTGVATALNIAVQTPETPVQLRALCQTTLSIVDSRLDSIDMDDPSAVQMFSALRQYGVINAQQAVAIDSLATAAIISRAEQIGLGPVVTVSDIEKSRLVPLVDVLRRRLANGYNAAISFLDSATVAPSWDDLIAVVQTA